MIKEYPNFNEIAILSLLFIIIIITVAQFFDTLLLLHFSRREIKLN